MAIESRPVGSEVRSTNWQRFAIGSPFWGTGLFMDAARLTVDVAFGGNGALAKIGAVREAVLRRSFLWRGEYLDQALWSIVREDWEQGKTFYGKAVWGSIVH